MTIDLNPDVNLSRRKFNVGLNETNAAADAELL